MSHFEFCHHLFRARDWQHRPEFDDVCSWWANGGSGVCALVGIGGVGKTAIADRFLQVLPGVMPARPDLIKRADLVPPTEVFVFSFYDAPNPDSFFAALTDFLCHRHAEDEVREAFTGRARNRRRTNTGVNIGTHENAIAPSNQQSTYERLLVALQSANRCLLVLDGLEKVQDDGLRGGVFGDLQDARLRDLLVRVSEGYVSHVSVLTTSRFPLAVLDEQRSGYYLPIAVDQLDMPAAIMLLKTRGVRGTDDQLVAIASECGLHALTVDLAGGYIAEFGAGDPATLLHLSRFDDEEDARRAEPTNGRRRSIRIQEHRFNRIAERYRDAFKERDPAALALLERICLFRLGVNAEMLSSIFTGEGETKQRISGAALAKLNRKQLNQTLDRLVAMKLVEQESSNAEFGAKQSGCEPNGPQQPNYAVHPAVRDGFLSGMDADTRRRGHEAVRVGLNATLGHVPGSRPSDRATLDLLEEILYHTTETGHISAAWSIYSSRIGGCHNLIARLNDFGRARRLTGLMLKLSELPTTKMAVSNRVFLHNDHGYSSLALGQLRNAKESLTRGLELSKEAPGHSHVHTLAGNLAHAHFLSGELRSALATLRESLRFASSREQALETLKLIAGVAVYVGHLDSQRWFDEARTSTSWNIPEDFEPELPPNVVYYLFGRSSAVPKLLSEIAAQQKTNPNGHACLAEDLLSYTEFLVEHCFNEVPQADLAHVQAWGIASGAKEIICQSVLVQARVNLAAICDATGGDDSQQVAPESNDCATAFEESDRALTEGLKVARDCGFGIIHVELLLTRARWFILRGEPQAALDVLQVALDDGVPVDAGTGQPELLAATHAECGYAWGIAQGMLLRGEALLMHAAQLLGRNSFDPSYYEDLPIAVRDVIDQARSCLTQSLDLWHALRDRDPNNTNFVRPECGTEYNYRASEAYRVINDVCIGVLTRIRLTPDALQIDTMSRRFKVALSFPGEYRDFVTQVAERLAAELGRKNVLYDKYHEAELARPNLDVHLPKLYREQSELIVLFLGPEYKQKRWCKLEWRHIRQLVESADDDRIMLLSFGPPGDLSEIGILPGDGYVDIGDRDPNAIGTLIMQRLRGAVDSIGVIKMTSNLTTQSATRETPRSSPGVSAFENDTVNVPSNATFISDGGSNPPAQKEVVVLIHGIRTFATWQPLVQRVLEEIPNTNVISIKYGYLDTFRFWFPIFTRQSAIDDLRREIQNTRSTNPDAKLSIIAHSFGTYAISQILVENPDVKVHRLVLSGAIIPRSFRWDYIRNRLARVVINDYGTRDIWPVLAKCLSWGYGDTGRHGFGRGAFVTDRGHDYAHGDFFNEDFVRRYWKPWFENDTFVPSEWNEMAPPPSWFLSSLSVVPLQWIILISLFWTSWWLGAKRFQLAPLRPTPPVVVPNDQLRTDLDLEIKFRFESANRAIESRRRKIADGDIRSGDSQVFFDPLIALDGKSQEGPLYPDFAVRTFPSLINQLRPLVPEAEQEQIDNSLSEYWKLSDRANTYSTASNQTQEKRTELIEACDAAITIVEAIRLRPSWKDANVTRSK